MTHGQYMVVAWGYSAAERNGNVGVGGFPVPATNTGGGLVTCVGGSRYSFTPGAYPGSLDSGPAARYGAGNFSFQAAPVTAPEPGAGLLIGANLLLAGGRGWRRRG